MPLPTDALLPYAKTKTPPLTLAHNLVPLQNKQARLTGRLALVPEVTLEDYQFRAVVDWIEFRLHFSHPTQAQHVQTLLRRFLDRDSHILAEDEGPGAVFSICTIKIQEPASLAQIAAIHQAMVSTFGEASGSRVTGLEVSIDATPEKPTDAARALLLGAMQRTIWTDRDIWSNRNSRPRTTFGRNSKENFTLSPAPEKDGAKLSRAVPENHQPPVIDGTMYLGAKDDEVMIRVMDKVKDGQRPDGTFIALDEARKRVRVEVTIRGTELEKVGITDIRSLDRLNLTKFQKRYFQFMLPTFSRRNKLKTGADVLHNTQQEWRARTFLRSGVTGLKAMDDTTAKNKQAMKRGMQRVLRRMNLVMGRIWAGTRLSAPVVSWVAMNRKVNVALRNLMKRETTAKSKVLDA